ncbi:VIN3-like protein 2 [Impatiens glandulifera]|uniref:VIN3-like protein 2 n=1 Tax=Impatiens glandulifera TaxID=253017 RepID=UPI001FB05170|nr:VIN3-like protein 2 [Impatiens glandulifera]
MDPNQLNLQEKLSLVYQVSKQTEEAAHKVLSYMTRADLAEILWAQTGLKRKYAGYTKHKLINRLLKLVNNKNHFNKSSSISNAFDRRKLLEHHEQQQQIVSSSQGNNNSTTTGVQQQSSLCRNLGCKAELVLQPPDETFCTICHRCCDHNNEDPSLWLVCESVPDHPHDGQSCGLSCHLECALENERMSNAGSLIELEKGFQCVSCGKNNNNGLIRSLHRQLLAAKEARRVHALSSHLKLSCQLVEGTEHYKELQKTVQLAAKTLENEVGPLQEAHKQMDFRIIGRLSCAADVQKLCLSALGIFDLLPIETRSNGLKQKERAACMISFEELLPTSVTIILDYEDYLLEEFLGCRLWHRKSRFKDYPKDATFVVLKPEKRFKLFGLDPSTKYFCKVSFFSDNRTLGIWEAKWDTPASRSSVSISEEPKGDKSINNISCGLSETCPPGKTSNDHHEKDKIIALTLSSKVSGMHNTSLITPTESNHQPTMEGGKKHVKESEYDYSVRIIRWMEKEGHVNLNFRVKFLTWFSLKATAGERRVVNVFVDTLADDPPSLVAQLLDAFSDQISDNPLKPGFCYRLWH